MKNRPMSAKRDMPQLFIESFQPEKTENKTVVALVEQFNNTYQNFQEFHRKTIEQLMQELKDFKNTRKTEIEQLRKAHEKELKEKDLFYQNHINRLTDEYSEFKKQTEEVALQRAEINLRKDIEKHKEMMKEHFEYKKKKFLEKIKKLKGYKRPRTQLEDKITQCDFSHQSRELSNQNARLRESLRQSQVEASLRQSQAEANLRQSKAESNLRQSYVEANLRQSQVEPNLRQSQVEANLRQNELEYNFNQSELKDNSSENELKEAFKDSQSKAKDDLKIDQSATNIDKEGFENISAQKESERYSDQIYESQSQFEYTDIIAKTTTEDFKLEKLCLDKDCQCNLSVSVQKKQMKIQCEIQEKNPPLDDEYLYTIEEKVEKVLKNKNKAIKALKKNLKNSTCQIKELENMIKTLNKELVY